MASPIGGDVIMKILENHKKRINKVHELFRKRMHIHRKRKRKIILILYSYVILLNQELQSRLWVKPRSEWWRRAGRINLNEWPDEMFRTNLRVSKATFLWPCAELFEHTKRQDTNFRKALPVETRIGVTLWRIASNVEYRTLRHLFGIGLSTACEVTIECIKLIWKILKPRFIGMPSGENFQQLLDGFEKTWSFPHCAGAIDGSHIPIIAPKDHHSDYFNRKGWHSILLQGLVDDKYKFLDVNIGWAGSVHDARVLSNSELYQQCEAGHFFPDVVRVLEGQEIKPFIIGDAAYPLLPWLIKPYPESSNMPADEKHFNYRLSHARMCVENAFGRLKGRFRILSKRIDCDLQTAKLMVGACCVLHNICEIHGDEFDENWVEHSPPDNKGCESAAVIHNHRKDGARVRNLLKDYCQSNPMKT